MNARFLKERNQPYEAVNHRYTDRITETSVGPVKAGTWKFHSDGVSDTRHQLPVIGLLLQRLEA